MNKVNWVCIRCSMWSSRRYSVQRHIDNVHDGISTVVSYMEYLVGRHNGVVPPPEEPARTADPKLKSQRPEKTSLLDTMADEFGRVSRKKWDSKPHEGRIREDCNTFRICTWIFSG